MTHKKLSKYDDPKNRGKISWLQMTYLKKKKDEKIRRLQSKQQGRSITVSLNSSYNKEPT